MKRRFQRSKVICLYKEQPVDGSSVFVDAFILNHVYIAVLQILLQYCNKYVLKIVLFFWLAAKKARKANRPLKRQVSSPSFQRKEKSAEKVALLSPVFPVYVPLSNEI